MSVYHGNEFILGLPDGLKDKTIHVFSLTDEGPSEVGVTIARDRPRSGETLEPFAERMLATLLGKLPRFELLVKERLTVGGQPAIATEYTWQSRDGKMFQRQVLLHARASGVMLIITATCRERLGARWEAMFKELLAGFHLRA